MRRLDRLGARVAEERAAEARELVQPLGERDAGLGPEQVRDVAERTPPARESASIGAGWPWPSEHDREAGDEVEVGGAVLVHRRVQPSPRTNAERALRVGRQDARPRRARRQIVVHARHHACPAPIRTRPTPPRSAAAQASSFGSMPPLARPAARRRAICGITRRRSSSTPGTSDRKTSSSAPSARGQRGRDVVGVDVQERRSAPSRRQRRDHRQPPAAQAASHLREVDARRARRPAPARRTRSRDAATSPSAAARRAAPAAARPDAARRETARRPSRDAGQRGRSVTRRPPTKRGSMPRSRISARDLRAAAVHDAPARGRPRPAQRPRGSRRERACAAELDDDDGASRGVLRVDAHVLGREVGAVDDRRCRRPAEVDPHAHLGAPRSAAGGLARRPATRRARRARAARRRSRRSIAVGLDVGAARAERRQHAAPVRVGAVQRAAHELVLGDRARRGARPRCVERRPTTS